MDRVGSYVTEDAAGTYDGQYLRVWAVTEQYRYETHGGIEEWLRRYYTACVDLYMGIVHGRAANSSSLPAHLQAVGADGAPPLPH